MSNLLKGLNVFLIGMMGTGKTTVGKLLAKKLGYYFIDTDTAIEQITQQTIEQIFATMGEEKFRELEGKVLAELSTYTKCAIATGGGIVLRQLNWSYLHHGLIVWLDASPKVLIDRLTDDTTRPLLQVPNPELKLKSLLEDRRPLYAQADLHVKIEANQTPEEIATRVIEMIPTVLKSKPTFPENN